MTYIFVIFDKILSYFNSKFEKLICSILETNFVIPHISVVDVFLFEKSIQRSGTLSAVSGSCVNMSCMKTTIVSRIVIESVT